MLFFASGALLLFKDNDHHEWYEPPVGSLTFSQESLNTVKITFGAFSSSIQPLDIKILIDSDASDHIELWFEKTPDNSTVEMGATEGITGTYTDLNYLGNSINMGDYMIVEGLEPNIRYTVRIYFYPIDSICPLVGNTSFILE
jgi:hypothetical protein